MKVLNLYACLGGNRLLWEDCEVTAVELDPELARMYQERFPNDTVIVADAHQYLLDHYKEFDFIWLSRGCPTHSRANFWASVNADNRKPYYPDFGLYEEIVFLDYWFKGKYVAENVMPYYTEFYERFYPGKKIGRHVFWSNFLIPEFETKDADIKDGNIKEWSKFHDVDISSYKGKQRKDKILRNLVHYDTGLHIFNLARGIHIANNSNQTSMFDQPNKLM